MIKTIKISVIFTTVFFLFSSCASIVSKSTYPLTINSNPSNAEISIANKRGVEIYSGNTPAVVQLKASDGFFSKAEYSVRFSVPGYEERIVPVTFSLDGWYFGNIFLGGILGMLIIDPATGAMWKIDTDVINITLRQSAISVNSELRIMDINEIPENWKSKLVKLN